MWGELPRTEQDFRVKQEMAAGEGEMDEHLIAVTEKDNVPSQKVLLKAGFEKFREWTEGSEDASKGIVNLVGFRYFPSR
ncbi:uncharacterized protein N7477_007843 [Penicillium maclennaniae]|uniref:uncharacterized protein n=1 Tax=Penicillium maclennaniae TaxID=1343394 RepID=UPI0025404AF6|nr:uncharacterized protein N7477_007843 [Penicillium maclennaniae]KAJ5665395.1 hypothetical protein N7477_007843 [Penicillium maclennaniae]